METEVKITDAEFEAMVDYDRFHALARAIYGGITIGKAA